MDFAVKAGRRAVRIRAAVVSAAAIMAALTGAVVSPRPAAAQTQTAHPFSGEALMKGVKISRDACAQIDHTVFVEAFGDGYCVRYYVGGTLRGGSAAVFFPGDAFGFDERGKIAPDPGYLTQAPEFVTIATQRWAQRLGGPAIFFGRLGMHGSSGWHGDRRTALEVAVTRAALDQIKAKEGLVGYHLIGQSGGGILVAAALAARDDVGCAMIGSAPLSFPIFARTYGIPIRKDGRRAHYDGMADAAAVAVRTVSGNGGRGTRLFVLTDPKDQAVPPASQSAFTDAVKAAGGRVTTMLTGGRGPQHHAVTEKAMFSAAMCIGGAPDEAILKRYAGTGPDDLPPP